VARHDREESLEEQLAWLDAIKDTEEAPVSVSASTASADEPVSSPYPKDPWRLVPTQHDTPTPPLFRAAVDSVYGSEVAEDLPEAESEAAEWLGTAATREEPKSPPPGPSADDPFHAPLKPLPRPDDTDTYALSFTPPAETGAPERTTDEPEDTSWPPADWTRPVKESSADWSQRPKEPPADWSQPAKESRPAEKPSGDWSRPAEESPGGWSRSDESPAAQEPARTEEPAPEEETREAWADTLPRNERPKWAEPLPKDEPTQPAPQSEPVQQRAEPAERRPEPPQKQEQRPQWTEQQEWRPAEREIPSPPPQPRRRTAPVPVFTVPPRPPVTGRPTADSLDPESLLRGRRNAPSKGWRRLIYKASGGWIKPGEPPEVRRRRELVARARTPVTTGHHRVAVLSLKGGVGKTTTTVGLGATLAQMRGDRVIAVDANPDRGTLSDKLHLETSATVRDLLNERDQVKRYVDIRAFTSQASSRLEVLASDRDPSISEAFSGSDYQDVSQVLENFYSICITDCGTGLLHSAMGGVLGLADQIVLVSSPSVDGARAASATLDWLEAHHYGDLVKNATVVLCSVRPRSKSAVDIKKLEAHFAARCRAVIRVPYDPHLEEGAEIDLDRLQESTRDAYLQLAACVGDGFAGIRE
jgi:MinD-like ATPase involved in chromosome partitioning or flagellar assembly